MYLIFELNTSLAHSQIFAHEYANEINALRDIL